MPRVIVPSIGGERPTTPIASAIVVLVYLLCVLTLSSSPTWAQAPGIWTDLGPTSRFTESAVICGKPGARPAPDCLPPVLPGGGNNQVSSSIDAWVDGDYAPSLGMLVIPRGGGHADWAGNQVIGFAPDQTPQWRLLTLTSLTAVKIPSTGPWTCTYPDGTPASVHSYGALGWMEWLGKLWTGGGIYWSPGGESVPPCAFWWTPGQPLASAWTQKGNRPGGYGTYAVADPTNVPPRVLLRTSSGLTAYYPQGDVSGVVGPEKYVTLWGQSNLSSSARALAPDRKLYSVSQQSGGGIAIQRADLNNLAEKEVALATTGGPIFPYGAGLRFDAGRLVLFAGGPTSTTGAIWTLVPENCGTVGLAKCVWTREIPPDGVHPPKPHVNGIWRRFFAHGCDYYVVVNGSTNVWKYRPAWALETCAPSTATLVVAVDPASTGAATVGGGGTFPIGTPVTPTVIFEPGSGLGDWTPLECGATFLLTANTTCTVNVLDIQAPVVSVASPTPNQLIKAPVPVTVTVTDNRPGVVTTMTLDGHPFAAGRSWTTIDPADMPEGFHGLVVTGTDRAGLTATVTVPFMTVQCPVCPSATSTLTVAKAGPGTGTVTGGGVFPVTAPVTVEAVPATGSTLASLLPVPCAQKPTFPMPATPLTCTATFALVPPVDPIPPGTAPISGLEPRTWKGMPAGPMGYTHKHTRLIHDSKRGRMILAGGDGTGPEGDSFTGQNVFAINLALSATWLKLHGYCPPAGAQMPSRPDDMTWGYDPKRDVGVSMPAYYGGAGSATVCAGFVWDTVKLPYLFNFESNQWQRSTIPAPVGGWGGDLHTHFGILDPVTDAVYRFHYACGMQMIPLDGSPGVCLALSFPGQAPISNMWNLSNDQAAIDVAGRMIYGISRPLRALVQWSITERKVVALIPMPATWVAPTGEFGGWEYETYLAFDSKNRVLFNPNTVGYGGTLIDTAAGVNRGLNFYYVDTKVWEWEAAPTTVTVSGNSLGYDATNNVFLFLGRSSSKQAWIYRVQ